MLSPAQIRFLHAMAVSRGVSTKGSTKPRTTGPKAATTPKTGIRGLKMSTGVAKALVSKATQTGNVGKIRGAKPSVKIRGI